MARLAFLALLLTGASASAAPSWDFVVHVSADPHAPLDVDWILHGFSGDLHLCSDREGGGQYFSRLRALTSHGDEALEPDEDDSDCWWATAPASGPLHLAYSVDLPRLAEGHGDPDWASRVEGGYIFSDEAVLLRPDPLPKDAKLTAEFRLPAGWSVAAPWTSLPGDVPRFQTTARQFDDGSYVAVGELSSLGEVPVRGGDFDLTLMGKRGVAYAETLRSWVEHAGWSITEFYRGLPAPRVEMILAGEPCGGRAGVFGTTLREEHPSVVLFFCADGEPKAFQEDWMPTHELFHLGNPMLKHRVPWFTEGVATYYQDVLRGRSRQRDSATMWGDLYDGFRRFCDPDDGVSLAKESRHLWEDHHYQRVYWGSACLFFRVDVAIREHSKGRNSLDDVLRDLLLRSRSHPLTEAQLVAALDHAAGAPIAREHLRSARHIALDGLYRKLGIEPTGPDTVRLHDDAPLTWIRQQIMPEWQQLE